MHQQSRRSKVILGILIILCVLMLTLYYREDSSSFFDSIRQAVSTVVVPFQIGVSKVVTPFRHGWQYLGEIGNLKEENTKLEKEIAALRRKVISLRRMEKENRRLKKLLGFKEENDYVTLPAYVIGRSVNSWEKTIVLDKGSSLGVGKNMPVVSSEGLVGQVVETTPISCKVQLIIDQKSGVGAQILATGETGILQGQVDGSLRLDFISKDSPLRRGDEVITSGLGGVFPKGILIGKVIKLKQSSYGPYRGVKVEPQVDFSRLEEVLIITNPPPQVVSGM